MVIQNCQSRLLTHAFMTATYAQLDHARGLRVQCRIGLRLHSSFLNPDFLELTKQNSKEYEYDTSGMAMLELI